MDQHAWDVAVIDANRFEAKILGDVLRNGGVSRIRFLSDSVDALSEFHIAPPGIILIALDASPIGAVEWVPQLRRSLECAARKASVFVVSGALTASLVANCRNAGANAIIGKPVSAATVINTIQKVVAKPRPFIETEAYVGPCRRPGIVTAGTVTLRRQSDAAA